MVYLEIVIGLALLLAGGEFLVRGAVAVAKRLGVSTLVIGLTLVGFGTSTPELVASIQAALAGSPGIAVGNVVGSNIANILLILGLAAVIYTVDVDRRGFRRDGLVLVLAAVAGVVACEIGLINRVVGFVFVLLLVAYVVWAYLTERTAGKDAEEHAQHAIEAHDAQTMSLWAGLAMAAVALVGIVFGADLLVGGAIVLAKELGVSDTVIGLTLVAVGTSLPELVTSCLAALRRQSDVAFGNVVGSNIYNVLGILGVTAVVTPIEVPAQIAVFDTWVMLGVTLLLTVFAVVSGRFTRWHGLSFLALYGAYLWVQLDPGVRATLGIA